MDAFVMRRSLVDPFRPGTRVAEFSMPAGYEGLVRVHGERNQIGEWYIHRNSIKGLSGPELKQKLSLPGPPPSELSDVVFLESIAIRRGIVNNNFGGAAGAVQYHVPELRKSPIKVSFKNRRMLQ